MVKFKRTNRTAQAPKEVILVGTGDSALASGALVDTTTSLGISNGQLGALSWDFDGTVSLGTFITAGVTASQVQAIKVVQGTPKSSAIHTVNPWEVEDKGYVESAIIYPSNIRSVATTKYSVGNYSAYAVTDLPTTTASTAYGAYVYLYGVRSDRDFGDNDEVVYEEIETPASLSGITDTKDWVVSRLIYKLNMRSAHANVSNSAGIMRGNKNYLAIGINTTGGYGQAIGTISSATPTTIPVMKDYDSDGNAITTNLIADNRLVAALAKLVKAQTDAAAAGDTITGQITASSTIEVVDLVNAGKGTQAQGTLTTTGNFTANDEVTIGTQTYTFVASPSSAYDVDLGSDAEESIDNLVAAINGTGTPGTEYAAGTEVNTSVTAEKATAATMLVTSKTYGTSANSIVFTEDTDGGGTWSLDGSGTLGGTTAATNSNIDAFVVLGLDSSTAAYDDNIWQVTNDVDVNLAGGYNVTTEYSTKVNGVEDTGTGREWTIANNDRAQLDVHTKQIQPHGDFFSAGKSYIDSSKNYTSTVLEYYDVEQTLTTTEVTPKRLTILLEATATATTVSSAITNLGSGDAISTATSDTTTLSSIEAILGAWIDSANTKFGLSYKNDASSGNIFV